MSAKGQIVHLYELWDVLIREYKWSYNDVMEADPEHLVEIISIKQNKNKRAYRDVVDASLAFDNVNDK